MVDHKIFVNHCVTHNLTNYSNLFNCTKLPLNLDFTYDYKSKNNLFNTQLLHLATAYSNQNP